MLTVSAEIRLPEDRDGPFAKRRICIIGRGPLGLFTALALSQNGAIVTMLGPLPTGEGVGFENAAGLIEPVATQDPRAALWLAEMIEFCDWAAADDAWGLVRRPVLFMSDDDEVISAEWLTDLDAAAAAEKDLRGIREYGTWFETYVMQPDLAKRGIVRELRNSGIEKSWSAEALTRNVAFDSVREAAGVAQKTFGAEIFILAPGLGLSQFKDIGKLVGPAASLSAGMGLTIEMPREAFDPSLEHVIMDYDGLGYLIPQKTRVIAGGTNHLLAHDDPIVANGGHPILNTEWEAEVRDKIELLRPGAGEIKGKVKVGARPMRHEVLTHASEDFDIPGLILSGAGGSGWTFSVGLAHAACREIYNRLGCSGKLRALGTGRLLSSSA